MIASVEVASAANAVRFETVSSAPVLQANAADQLRFKEAMSTKSSDQINSPAIDGAVKFQTDLNQLIQRLSNPIQFAQPAADAPAEQHYAYMNQMMLESRKSSMEVSMMTMTMSTTAETGKKTEGALKTLLQQQG